jgi:DNA-binding IclR family transcriptional regulator
MTDGISPEAWATGAAEDAPPRLPEVAGAQLLARALSLLFRLREADEPLSAGQLGDGLGVPASNTYRLLQQLEVSGLVERRARNEIVLGLRCLDLGGAVRERIDREIGRTAGPVMEELTRRTGETTLLTMRTGLQAICVLSVDSARPFRLSYELGRVMPMYRGASGRILLAHQRRRLVEQVLAEMAPYVSETGEHVTPEMMTAVLVGIRTDGYCVTRSELDAGATGIAAPILGASDRLVAGLTVAGPSNRVPDERLPSLIDEVRAAAARVEQRLADGRRTLRSTPRVDGNRE